MIEYYEYHYQCDGLELSVVYTINWLTIEDFK